jgi:hypothetical protein
MNDTTLHETSTASVPVSTDLSAVAHDRKAAILADLRGELRATRTRRTLTRAGSVAALLLITATLVWVARYPLQDGSKGGGDGSALTHGNTKPSAADSALKPLPEGGVGVGSVASIATQDRRPRNDSPVNATPPKITIAYIQTDPTILDRLATRPSLARIEQIGDDELLQAMHDAGKPAGLIRARGQLTVVELAAPTTVGG